MDIYSIKLHTIDIIINQDKYVASDESYEYGHQGTLELEH